MPKLEVGDVNDPLERQADAIAVRVMRMPAPRREPSVGLAPEPDAKIDGELEDERSSGPSRAGTLASSRARS